MSLKRNENHLRGFGDFSMSVCMVPLLVDGMELKAPDYSSSLKDDSSALLSFGLGASAVAARRSAPKNAPPPTKPCNPMISPMNT
jgi:hypothetical protein